MHLSFTAPWVTGQLSSSPFSAEAPSMEKRQENEVKERKRGNSKLGGARGTMGRGKRLSLFPATPASYNFLTPGSARLVSLSPGFPRLISTNDYWQRIRPRWGNCQFFFNKSECLWVCPTWALLELNHDCTSQQAVKITFLYYIACQWNLR